MFLLQHSVHLDNIPYYLSSAELLKLGGTFNGLTEGVVKSLNMILGVPSFCMIKCMDVSLRSNAIGFCCFIQSHPKIMYM
jgi:hypothetical protein